MWILCAFGAAWLQASTRILNQYFKYSGLSLTFAVKALHLLYILPFLPFIEWSDKPVFYLLAAATAPLVLYQDKTLYDFTAKFGAGPVTRVEPLSVPFVFLAWLLMHPALLIGHFERPFQLAGIAACICAATFFALRMRSCAVSADVLKSMLPLVVVAGVINITAKIAIDYAPNREGIMAYIVVQTVLVVLLSYLSKKKESARVFESFKDKKFLKASFLLSLLLFGLIVLRLYGFILTPNPAYVTAVMLTGPLWILLFYKAVRHEEKGDIKSGLGIVLSAILLTMLTRK